MRRGLSPILVFASCARSVAAMLDAGDLVEGEVQYVSADSRLALRASGTIGVGVGYFGVAGGANDKAVDDVDGLAPADEWLEIELAADSGLEGLEVIWSRGLLRLEGFSADPLASEGTYDAGTGTWTVFRAWTAGTVKSYVFGNAAASAGQTLKFSVSDETTANPQSAIASLSYKAPVPLPGDVVLVADPGNPGQVIKQFGASMLWTIDPTEGWPEETREALALKLMSEAGGIGLSNLRFDFGGGDTGTGNQTSEPWSWRFPKALKDGEFSPFDWTRREGQQWFLRRSVELGVEQRSLASISPPWWMTKSGRSYPNVGGGTTNLDPGKVGDYGEYLADVVEHFKVAEGIVFDEVSPVNEPEWDWSGGSQEGNGGTAADIRPVVSALHAELVARGLDGETKISIGEHGVINALLDDSYHQAYNGGAWNGGNNGAGLGKYREYLEDLTSHPSIVGKVDPVAAYHSYFNDSVGILNGNLRSLLAANAAARGVGVMQTEYCILGSYGPVRDLQMEPARHVFRVIHKDMLEADAVGWNWWLALSPHDYKDGLVYTNFNAVSDVNPELYDSKAMWALGHFSRFIRPGWQRIGSGGVDDLEGMMSTAWQSPDGREVVIVAANFGSSEVTVQLPSSLSGQAGVIREWSPWVTDRGRSLRRESAVESVFVMAPLSMSTFVGRVTEAPFRLRTVVNAEAWSVVPGNETDLAAAATWEDGRFDIPALGAGEHWIFQPVGRSPDGSLKAGRYWIRRESDGSYLNLGSGSGLSVDVVLSPVNSAGTQWDVLPVGEGEVLVTESESGRVLAPGVPGPVALRAGGVALAAQRLDLSANFDWEDGLGSGAQTSLTMVTPRWVAVGGEVGADRAVGRVRLRAGQALPALAGLPELVFSRPGDPVDLAVEPVDLGMPWRFRLVPSDRDSVISRTGGGSVQMRLPKGDQGELWELVTPGGGRVMTGVEPGAVCWIRAVGGSGYLEPELGGTSWGTPVVLGVGAAGRSDWVIVPGTGSQMKIEHPASGLVLNISGGTGLPILWPGEGSGNERFHLDAVDDDPLQVYWSHELGSGLRQTVSPLTTTEYVAHAERGGVRTSLSTVIVVQRTFAEWSMQWHGTVVGAASDVDGDGATEILEYSRGSNPLLADSGEGWREFGVDGEEHRLVWRKNREALGTWTVETSVDLSEWVDAPVGWVVEADDEIVVALDPDLHEARYYRLRFTAGT